MNMYDFVILLLVLGIFACVCIAASARDRKERHDKKLEELKKILEPVFPDINRVELLRGNKSYTLDKKRIYLCLRDEHGEYYETNMLIYVLLHELAHVRCPEIGHTKLFYEIFDELLDLAIRHKIYNPNIPVIKDYCEYSKS